MADRKISDLTPLTAPAAGDYLPIVDISEAAASSKNKRITIEELMRGAPDGTAGAPGFAFESDPNSGIYSPGADQVAISTGGSGRLFIDASGNVGVGTTSPVALLQPNGTVSITGGSGASSANGLHLYFDTATNSGTITAFHSGVDNRNLTLDGKTIGFTIAGSERLRITSAGLVGVGTSSPSYKFEVDNSGGSTATARLVGNDQANVRLRIQNTGSGGRAYEIVGGLNGANNSHLSIYDATTAATRLTITETGLVGVGTTSPVAPLDVNGNISLSGNGTNPRYLALLSETSTYAGSYILQAGGGSAGFGGAITMYGHSHATYPGSVYIGTSAGSSGSIIFGTNNAIDPANEKVRITSAGLVGIGNSSPGSKLHVAGGATVVSIGSNDAGDTGAAIFYGTGTKYNWKIGAQQNVDNAFEITPSTAAGGTTFTTPSLVINSAGNVGIGTTAPGQLLEIHGASNPAALVKNTTSNVQAYFYASSTAGIFGTPTVHPLVFNVENLEKARIDTSGRLLVGTSTAVGSSNAVVIKGTSGVSNASIYLGNTANASTLIAGNTLGFIEYGSADGGIGAQVLAAADGTWSSTSDCPTRLVFSTTADGASSPTERMRIDNAGQFVFNSATYGLRAQTGSAAGTTIQIFSGFYSASTPGTGTACIYIHSNGNVENTNNSYGAISDIKLKENIVDAGSQWDDLKALQVRKYNFKEGQTHTQIGLVAQEVELVSPGLVSESPDRDEEGNDLGTVTKSVNYSVLYMKAVKALQEAMERIEVLEQRLNDAGIN
jgi:hypothetical protein